MSILFDVVLFLREKGKQLKLNPVQKVILFTLAGRIGKNKDCWIKQSELAKECELSIRYFKTNLKIILDHKIIISDKIITKKGKQNRYRFNENWITLVLSAAPSSEDTTCSIQHQGSIPRCSPQHLPKCSRQHLGPRKKTSKAPAPVELEDIPIFVKETIETNNKDKERKKKEKVDLPDWLPEQDWNEFLEFRKGIRAPMGEIAQKRAMNVLKKFREAGHDVLKVIDQSIVNGWKGLFPLKEDLNYAKGSDTRKLTYRQEIHKRTWDRLKNWN